MSSSASSSVLLDSCAQPVSVHVAAIRIKIECNHALGDYCSGAFQARGVLSSADDGRTRKSLLLYDIMEMMGC